MTVSANVSRVTFAGDDVTTSFDLGSTFIFFAETELQVSVVTDATGVEEDLTLTTDYTVSGGDGATGTVDTSGGHGALLTGTTLVVRRVLPITQTDDFVNGQISDAEVIEDRFDRLTMIAQQLDDESARALRAPTTEDEIDPLPTRAARRNKFFKFDDTADAKPTAVAITEISDGGTVLDEDDFGTDSETDAPSQQSAAAYIASQILDEDDFASDSATKAASQQSVRQLALDEDDFASDSSFRPPTQQSTKAYITGKHTIWVPASDMIVPTSNGCAPLAKVEYEAGNVDLNVLDFDGSSNEFAVFQKAMPKGWDEGDLSFQIYWTTTATDTDAVVFIIQGRALSDNGVITQAHAGGVNITDAAQGAADRVLVSSESSGLTLQGSPAEGDLCTFRLGRTPGAAGDTMSEDARVIGLKIFFTTDAPTDD